MAITNAAGSPYWNGTGVLTLATTWVGTTNSAWIIIETAGLVTGVTSPKATWTHSARITVTGGTAVFDLWQGVISSTGADTITVATSSGTVTAIYGWELVDSAGINKWAYVAGAGQKNTASSTNIPFSSITSGPLGLQAFLGVALAGATANGVSTAGFAATTNANGDESIFDGTLATGTAYAPIATQNSATTSQSFGVIIANQPPYPGTAAEAATLTGTAAGKVGVPATATGSTSLTGTAVGIWGTNGTAAGTATLSGLASGAIKIPSTASGTISLNGVAVGVVTIPATTTGTTTLTGLATGVVITSSPGLGYGGVPYGGAAYGDVPSNTYQATGTGPLTLTGLATGAVKIPSTATGLVTLTGVATGAVGVTASASGSTSLAGLASGTLGAFGSSTTSLSGLATGHIAIPGTSSGTSTLSGRATGVITIPATGALTASLTGIAVGTYSTSFAGSGTSSATLTSLATGTVTIPGTASGALGLTGIAVGVSSALTASITGYFALRLRAIRRDEVDKNGNTVSVTYRP